MNTLSELFNPTTRPLRFENLHPDFKKTMPEAEWVTTNASVPEMCILIYTSFLRGVVVGAGATQKLSAMGLLTVLTAITTLKQIETAVDKYKAEIETADGLPVNLNVKDN